VYDGAEAEAYTLPDEVWSARAAFLAVLEANRASRGTNADLDPRVLEDRAVEAIFAAADAGQPLFDPATPPAWTADLLAARQDAERRQAEGRALAAATERAADRLTADADGWSDLVITDHLRPALLEVVKATAKIAPRAAHLPWDKPEMVIGMATAPRNAWDEMTRISTRYRAIRKAQDTLWRVTENPEATLWRLIEMRNLRDVWPAAGSWQEKVAPWPKDSRARLLWLVERDAQAGLWCPTPEEARSAMREQAAALQKRLAQVPVSAGAAQ
jgi:hypothetical protein